MVKGSFALSWLKGLILYHHKRTIYSVKPNSSCSLAMQKGHLLCQGKVILYCQGKSVGLFILSKQIGLIFYIADMPYTLSLQISIIFYHCKQAIYSIIANRSYILSLQIRLILYHCKQALYSIIANRPYILSLQIGLILYHCKWILYSIEANGSCTLSKLKSPAKHKDAEIDN